MTESLGREAFGVFEDVLLEEIASENKSIQEDINGLKMCQKMLEEVHVCIGKESHTFSILDGVIDTDEPLRRAGHNQGDVTLFDSNIVMIGLGRSNLDQEERDTSLGTVIKFHLDRFKVPTFTLDAFKTEEEIGPDGEPGCWVSSVAALEYVGSFCAINDIVNGLRLYLKAAEDDSTASFYFCRDRVTFQGTLHSIGPKDMARGMEGLANQISAYTMGMGYMNQLVAIIGGKIPEYHQLNYFFYDSPEMYFKLESISIQFTPEVSRAYDLARKIEVLTEANVLEVNSIDSLDLTRSDVLRGQVAVSLVFGKLVDGLSTNKQLRCELKSLRYMKSMLQNAILKCDGDILCEINLNKGMMYSDYLRETAQAGHISDATDHLWRISLGDENISLEINWLDKFAVTIGATRHFEASGTFFDSAQVFEQGAIQFMVGDVRVCGYMDFSLQSLNNSEDIDNHVREVMNEDFQQKLSKATLPGVSADFPEWFKMTITHIAVPIEIIKMFLDIGK